MDRDRFDEDRKWFCDRVRGTPEYVETTFFPAYERALVRALHELHKANRDGDFPEIKYRQGWFDGVHEIMSLLGGLRLNKSEKPIEPGLRARILGLGRSNTNA